MRTTLLLTLAFSSVLVLAGTAHGQVCVVEGRTLRSLHVEIDPVSGDTTFNSVPFSLAFPTSASHAASATWYINNEPITFRSRRYEKHGLSRMLQPGDVKWIGEFQGVGVFTAVGDAAASTLYVPVRPGCEFQPYTSEQSSAAATTILVKTCPLDAQIYLVLQDDLNLNPGIMKGLNLQSGYFKGMVHVADGLSLDAEERPYRVVVKWSSGDPQDYSVKAVKSKPNKVFAKLVNHPASCW